MKFREYIKESIRGFRNKLALGDEIEVMDSTIEKKDRKKFDKILGSYLDKFDVEGNLSIRDCVNKLSNKEAINLYDELTDLHYNE